jgi:Flp pilus assembly protein TadD
MVAANAGDWATVRTLTAAAAPPAPVSKADKAASAAAFARGTKALLNKNNAAAITAFQLAIEANGANMDARNKLGIAYIRAGEYEHAHQVLGELVAEAPRHVEGWRNMAEAAALSGRPEEADASLRVLLHLSKDRKRTTEALKKRAASGEPDKFGEAVARVATPDTSKARK